MSDDTLERLLHDLVIPEDFQRYDTIAEEHIFNRLQDWRRDAVAVLRDLHGHLKRREAFSVEEQARILSVAAQFDGEGPWIVDPVREAARDILAAYEPPSQQLLENILLHHLKPIFQANAHPSVNPSTGRTIPRPAGGPLAGLDHLEGQVWKTHPGLTSLIIWCVRHTESDAYEKLWHLIIPPVMTILDDFEPRFKLRGVQIVSEMLKKVPKVLLRRTGIDALLYTSLKKCLNFLQNPETSDLIRAATLATLTLIELTAAPGSPARFDQLCGLLGDGLIGSVWMYASLQPEALDASLDVLPDVVRALDIGTVRYLKAIIPQLVFPLLPVPENGASIRLQAKSVQALAVVIDVCAPRMHVWKGEILDGLLKCWVCLVDSGAIVDDESGKLKDALRDACARLAQACPSVIEAEYARVLEADKRMFEPLLGAIGLRLAE